MGLRRLGTGMFLNVRQGLVLITAIALGLSVLGCANRDLKPSSSLNELPPPDPNAAIEALRMRADQGDVDAQVALGEMYSKGDRVARSYKEAVKWYRLAAEQGDQWAQYSLGDMYANGLGVSEDKVLAYMWSYVVISSGVGADTGRDETARWNARSNLSLLGMFAGTLPDQLTPAQISGAKDMAHKCQVQHFKQCEGTLSFRTGVDTASLATPRNPSSVNNFTTTSEQLLPQTDSTATSRKIVQLENDGGTYVVPVVINGIISLRFTVDSGAADVSIPADVFLTLMRAGTIAESDLVGKQTYVLADGSKVPSQTFVIRSLKVGNVVVENVLANVASVKGSLLLGQSFLKRVRSWSIDNKRHVLVLE